MKQEVKKLLIRGLPYLLFVYLFDKIGAAIRLTPGADASEKLLQLGTGFAAAFSSIAPSLHPIDLLIGIAGAVIVRLAVYMKGKNAKKYRKGMEYGSARWGGAEDIKPYIDPVFENNVLLTQTERLMMSSRPKQPKYARNKNILVIGGSGSGKTRFFVKPNLMQMHSSYVVTDPKGTVLIECGKLLQRGRYKIKVLNTINFKKSMKYNPFAYLRSEKDILKLVNTIIANTKGDGDKSGEDFWVKAEKLYYTALIGYIWYEAPDEEKNFTTLLEMINASEAREDDEDFKNPVDLMFERLEEKDPEHFAVKQYKKYKLAAGVADGQRLPTLPAFEKPREQARLAGSPRTLAGFELALHDGKVSLVHQRLMRPLHHDPVLRPLTADSPDLEAVLRFLRSDRPGVDGIHQQVFYHGEVPDIFPVLRVLLLPPGADVAYPALPVPPCGAGELPFLQPAPDMVRAVPLQCVPEYQPDNGGCFRVDQQVVLVLRVFPVSKRSDAAGKLAFLRFQQVGRMDFLGNVLAVHLV